MTLTNDLLDARDRWRHRLEPHAPIIGAAIIVALLLFGVGCLGPASEHRSQFALFPAHGGSSMAAVGPDPLPHTTGPTADPKGTL